MNYEFRLQPVRLPLANAGPIKNGFTLTEFIITIGIIIILTSIGIPVFRSIRPSFQLSGTARNLVTDLHYAQQLAVTEQVDHGVLFSTTTEDKYQIIRHENATTTVLKEELLPEGIDFQQISPLSNNEIRFNPYGAAKEEGEITLINTKNSTTVLDIRPSGFIKIID